jgi:histidinol-phosphate phosphatase family protein
MDGPFLRVTTVLPLEKRRRSPVAFLDRDGVVNLGRPGYVNSPDEVVLLPGAAACIADLKRAGYLVCIVTNQSAISRKLWGRDQLCHIHRFLQDCLLSQDDEAHIDAFITCPHRFEDRCSCRKPSPTMLFLGHQVLRSGHPFPVDELYNAGFQERTVDWWGRKVDPFHRLDAMVGDRRSDMGAGWGYGARLFRVDRDVGLVQACERVLNENDLGDRFQP